jgi:serine/threonine-protein kinase RsbW
MAHAVRVSLPTGLDAPAGARAALDTLDANLGYEELERLRLLVSELVTNAVRHAGLSRGDEIALHVEVDADALRGQVHDPGPGFEPPSLDGPMTRNGQWGLWLVDEIADRWGVRNERGATVWFEMARAASQARAVAPA